MQARRKDTLEPQDPLFSSDLSELEESHEVSSSWPIMFSFLWKLPNSG